MRVGKKEYEALKALAKQRGQFLRFVLNEAIRKYIEASKVNEIGER